MIRPDPFNQVILAEFSNRVAEALSVPMIPDLFRVRIGDPLFGYELTASFFGDNVQIKRTADRVSLTFKNARSISDLQFIGARIAGFLDLCTTPGQVGVVSAFVHGGCHTPEERDAFLAPYAVSREVTGPGLTGRVKVPEWPDLIKVTAERSFIESKGLYIAWETTYTRPAFSPGSFQRDATFWERFEAGLQAASKVFGIDFKFD